MSQMELDIQDHILGQTKKLSDGSFGKIYSRNDRNDFGIFTYNCHLCSVANLPGEIALRTHINGRKHQSRLDYKYVPDVKQFKAPLSIHPKMQPMRPNFPFGEPRPPGLEDEGTAACYLDQFLSKCDKPLIGVEYILELLDPKLKEPLYICTLCDKRCDPRNILPQMTSHRHRMKYLDTHFPKLMNILNRDRQFNVDMAHREEVLTKIAKQLEKLFGRGKPSIYEYREYDRNKEVIIERVKNLKHFNEESLSGSEKILLQDIKVEQLHLDDVSSDDSDNNENFEKHCERKKKEKNTNNNHSKYIIERGPTRFADNREKPISHNPQPSTSKFMSHRELMAQSEIKFKDAYTFEKFKSLLQIETQRIEVKYKDFEKNPEKHPHYSEEWKSFWQRRYNELLALGKDANGHNYKPEWVEFWMPRMKQIKLKEIEDKKKEIRKKLDITPEAAKKYEQDLIKKVASPKRTRSRSMSYSPSPDRDRSHGRRKSRSPVVISDDSDDDEDYYRRRRDESKRPRRDRSDSRSRHRYSESPVNYRGRSRERSRRSESSEVTDDAPVNIVTVCRLLTALESELGIIAPRVVKILEDALSMEREEPNSSEHMLLEMPNINFLDTVKEKLKGLLSADLVGPSRMIPVKRAIKNIAALLHEAQKLKAKQPPSTSTSKPSGSGGAYQPDSVELAKLDIAKVLAQTLIDQGRTNVSPEELQEIVDEFLKSQMEETQKTEAKKEPEEKFKPSTSQPPKEEKKDDESGLENLTDDDLKTLLRNFSDLTEEEQKHLIKYLEKLEKTDARRVKMLSRYVDAGDDEIEDEEQSNDVEMTYECKKESPKHESNNLSDDEYDDDNDQGPSRLTNQSMPSFSQSSATLSNNQHVAAELFSSLMESQQQPSMAQWNWDMSSQTYFQQPGFHNMQPQAPLYNYNQPMGGGMPMMNQPSGGGGGMPMLNQPYAPGPWVNPQQSFDQVAFANRQRQPSTSGIPPPNSVANAAAARKKENQRSNNHQLTGKGKNRSNNGNPN